MNGNTPVYVMVAERMEGIRPEPVFQILRVIPCELSQAMQVHRDLIMPLYRDHPRLTFWLVYRDPANPITMGQAAQEEPK